MVKSNLRLHMMIPSTSRLIPNIVAIGFLPKSNLLNPLCMCIPGLTSQRAKIYELKMCLVDLFYFKTSILIRSC